MYTITVKRELDFNDLMDECWSGALETLKTIAEHNKEDELMFLLGYDALGDTPDLGDVNDLLWFEDEWIFEQLGINPDDDMGEDDDD